MPCSSRASCRRCSRWAAAAVCSMRPAQARITRMRTRKSHSGASGRSVRPRAQARPFPTLPAVRKNPVRILPLPRPAWGPIPCVACDRRSGQSARSLTCTATRRTRPATRLRDSSNKAGHAEHAACVSFTGSVTVQRVGNPYLNRASLHGCRSCPGFRPSQRRRPRMAAGVPSWCYCGSLRKSTSSCVAASGRLVISDTTKITAKATGAPNAPAAIG